MKIISFPDEILRSKSSKVESVNSPIISLVHDMTDAMNSNYGIGLAAVQIGKPLNVVVMHVTKERAGESEMNMEDSKGAKCFEEKYITLINPIVKSVDGPEVSFREGCLSFPGQFASVKRKSRAAISYLDEKGREQTMLAGGLLARCILHEIDHLNGVVFVDLINPSKKDMIVRKLNKLSK